MHIRILLLVFMALSLVTASCTGETLPYTLADESMLPQFLADAPPRVREAYRFAMNNMDEMENYPCYCGCGNMGHTSILGCYIKDADRAGNFTFDDHASGCGICVDITQDVMRLLKEGRTSVEIRSYVDATYSAFGPSTDTPLPQG